MAKESQLPIKEVLAAIDRKDRDWYLRLPSEKKKHFNSYLLQRYISSAQGKHQAHFLYFTNHCVNHHYSDIPKEHQKELQWLLFTAIGKGKLEAHPYIKPPNTRKKKNKLMTLLATLYPHLRTYELEILLSINDKKEIKELAIAHGYDNKQIRDIFGKV